MGPNLALCLLKHVETMFLKVKAQIFWFNRCFPRPSLAWPSAVFFLGARASVARGLPGPGGFGDETAMIL